MDVARIIFGLFVMSWESPTNQRWMNFYSLLSKKSGQTFKVLDVSRDNNFTLIITGIIFLLVCEMLSIVQN